MDIRLPDMSGIDAMIAIRSEFPEARIVMLTTFEGDVEIQRALQAGARGYLLKSMPPRELLAGIREVHAGRKWIPPEVAAHLAEHMGEEALTARELEVLQHVAGGNRNRDIAGQLFISEETVKVHIKHIMEKLGARDRTEAVAIALRRGIIRLVIIGSAVITHQGCKDTTIEGFARPGNPVACAMVYGTHPRRSREVQRLFSSFPRGWPGLGLLLLRVAVGFSLVVQGGACLAARSPGDGCWWPVCWKYWWERHC